MNNFAYRDFNVVIFKDEGSINDGEFGGHAKLNQDKFLNKMDGWMDGFIYIRAKLDASKRRVHL
jgi:hypothetical protein